jgi:hypothetical protein
MVFRRMRMVVTVFRPRLHYKGARAKATAKAKIQAKFRIFPAPARFFAARLTAPARGAILSADSTERRLHSGRKSVQYTCTGGVSDGSDTHGGAQTCLPYFAHGTLLWYCTQHGLFAQPIDAHKE